MNAESSPDLSDKQFTLGELAFRLQPQIYRDWKATVEARRKEAALGSSFPSWARSEAAGYLADLRYGTCYSQFTKEERQFNDLVVRLHGALRKAIASPDNLTHGFRADGSMIEVPRNIVQQLKIDLENNTLSTSDGGVVWRAVFVRRTAPPAAVTEQQRVGRPRKWDWDGAMAYLVARANTPDGLPTVQADVEQMMAAYFERINHGDCPTESLIREKVQLVFSAMKQEKGRR